MTVHNDMDIGSILKKAAPESLSLIIVNLENVAKNYGIVKDFVPKEVEVAAVVKANAYGLGAIPVSKKLYYHCGCRKFFVATIDEGINVRKCIGDDAEIIVLSGVFPRTEHILYSHKLIPVLNCKEQADLWVAFSQEKQEKLQAVIHVDTGMARNGFYDSSMNFSEILDKLDIVFVMSHLACADDISASKNNEQLERFRDIAKYFTGIKKCLSATNGIFLGDNFHFDIVRPGKALYGFAIRNDWLGKLYPVVEIFARIVQINRLKKGDTIGYGATFTAGRDMTTVTVGMGYADGFMRKFAGFGAGFIDGHKMPMVGRISMDYMVFDASDVPANSLKFGNWVALTQYPDYTMEKWALELGTIPHEVTCRLGIRSERFYFGEVK